MFGLFAPETVAYIDLRSGILTFLSKKRRSLGGSTKVRLSVPGQPKPQNYDIPVSIISVRQVTAVSGFICVAHVLVDETRYPALEETLKRIPVRPDLGLAARRSARFSVSLRVMSRELPGFGAVTVDISNHGVRLATHGPVTEGNYMRLTIELDVGSMNPHLPIPGKAVWSRPDPRSKGHFVGVEFCDIEPQVQDHLNRYMRSLSDRMGGDVMHRSISDGEVYIRGDENVAKPKS